MWTTRAVLAIVLVIFLACATYAAAPAIQQALPVKGSVPGFTAMPDSLTYGKGTDVSKIYDGGYEVYTRNGVIDAARQMYQRGNDFVEVTVHTMKSPKAAQDFIKYWAKEREIGKLTATKTGQGFVAMKPNVTAYQSMGKYFVTVAAFYSNAKATKDVKDFVSAVAKRLPKK